VISRGEAFIVGIGEVISFFSFSPEIWKIIYTINAIESLNMQIRKVLKNKVDFPSDAAVTKLIYLALQNINRKWKSAPVTWRAAIRQFAIQFGARFLESARWFQKVKPSKHDAHIKFRTLPVAEWQPRPKSSPPNFRPHAVASRGLFASGR
jgi:hypothetical protein